MTRSEIKEFLTSTFNKIDSNLRETLYHKYKDVYDAIYSETSYLTNAKITERLYHIMNDLYDVQKCKYCNEKAVTFNTFQSGYNRFCSTKCMANSDEVINKRNNTCLNRYGAKSYFQTEEFWDKYKNTCLDKYGVESHNQSEEVKHAKINTYLSNYSVDNPSKSNIVKQKKQNTCLQNFGVISPLKSEDVLDKVRQTCLDTYGVDNPMKSEEVVELGRNTSLEKYGVDHHTKTEEYSRKIRESFLRKHFDKLLKAKQLQFLDDELISLRHLHNWKCLVCGTKFKARYNSLRDGLTCPGCYPRIISRFERELESTLREKYSGEIILNDREVIKPYEIDLYFPDESFGIEFNGLYWHSEEHISDKNYHLMKTNLCREKGIRLVHIFEDEWLLKKNIVINTIEHILGLNDDKQKIYARKCTIQEIDPKLKNEFLEQFHLQGKDSSNTKLGAFYNGELVAVMTFSKSNISRSLHRQEGVWELTRFATNYNYLIPGIASKLLDYFKRNYDWNRLITYADKRWVDSSHNLYHTLGFQHEYDNKPNYWYISKSNMRLHRYTLRKLENDPQHIPEQILRQSEGYGVIWDCGTMKFSMASTNSFKQG